MQKTILVIEDNPNQAEMMLGIIHEMSPEAIVYHAKQSDEAYRILMENTIDVFLVDIVLNTKELGDTSGIRLAKKIREIPKYLFTPLIFVTSLEDPELYAYRSLHCFGYIEKPYEAKQVQDILQQALQFKTSNDEECVLHFRRDGILYPVKCRDVLYIESIQHMMHIHMVSGKELKIPYKTAKQIIREADFSSFLQCSRNVIINTAYVEDVDMTNRYLTLGHTSYKPAIGVTYVKKVIEAFKK